MNYGELRDTFKELLNRTDCTDDLADKFIGLGVRRTERVIRTPLQETSVKTTLDDTWQGYIPLPSDYLAHSTVRVNGKTLYRLAEAQGRPASNHGTPEMYYIKGAHLYFMPDLKVGDEIDLTYYYEFSNNQSEDSITKYGYVIPDVVMYAAMVYACIHFTDNRKNEMKEMLKELVEEVQSMADADEMMGGMLAIKNPYEGEC